MDSIQIDHFEGEFGETFPFESDTANLCYLGKVFHIVECRSMEQFNTVLF